MRMRDVTVITRGLGAVLPEFVSKRIKKRIPSSRPNSHG
jgi:hypothetical protein